jgi:ABC-type branched-subunit amino acid transport system substrate-binding protein
MKRSRSQRLRVPAIAVVATAALAVAACSSSPSSSSGSTSSGSSSSAALTASAPGITATTITIGSHQPLTGPVAPGYSEIAPASAAYFAYVSAHGGVNGRKIVYKYLDDAYNPTTTATVVRQLVLQKNAQKVPDVFVASGCSCWNQPSLYPETFGYQLDYVREGKILGQYVAQQFKGMKVAYFYQNDEFGTDGVKGLDYEIPKSMVVARQSYVPTNVNIAPQVAALKASGAQVVVAFSVPAFTALLKLYSGKFGYSPALVVSDVNNDVYTLDTLLEAYAKQGGATVKGSELTNGIITDSYLPTLAETSNSWVTLFKMVHDQYDAKEPWDGNAYYGEAVAYAFVQAMLKAGKNPTRSDLVNAINGGLPQGPVVAPYAYSSSDHAGATGAFMAVMSNGGLTQKGSVLTTDTTASGPITTYSGAESQAPASGIPSP